MRDTDAVLIQQLKDGGRLALAQTITLLESDRREDQLRIDDVMAQISAIANTKKTLRLGITGAPGAGKSSLIEKIGMNLIQKGHKVAVLAIDPSSEITRGSVLGDKTRMEELAASDSAFIRPSPSRGSLGGVNVATHDAIQACEAGGYDIVIVETVGVGQSESQVAELVDLYVLVALPGAGDELQGIKRGVLEKVDVVLVNKFDGESKIAAQLAEKQLKSSLQILRQREIPLFLTSALYGHGLAEFCQFCLKTWESSATQFQNNRHQQEASWVRYSIEQFMHRELEHLLETNESLAQQTAMVLSGTQSPRRVAREFVRTLLKS